MPTLIDKSGNIDYFGHLSWANFLDWIITACLAGIVVLTTFGLGGVRPETQHAILPLYAVTAALHGLWCVVNRERPRYVNPAPLLFAPFLIFAALSCLFFSPVPWRGAYELTYFFGAFIFVWVAVNNVRTRAHLWALILASILPALKAAFIGFYQFFQEPTRIVKASVGYALELNERYLGQATGIFADPNSFATYFLILLPCIMIAAFVPRLSVILRVLCFYIGVIIIAGIAFAQIYWAAVAVVVLMVVVPGFCFQKGHKRVVAVLLGVSTAMSVFLCMIFISPQFKDGLVEALSPQGEGVRLVLWEACVGSLSESPLFGHGAGSYGFEFMHKGDVALAEIPDTPYNDYLHILVQYGLLGWALLFFPMAYILFRAYRSWSGEPFRVKFMARKGKVMPPQKFLLAIAICGTIACAIASCFTFVYYIPALLLCAATLFSILIKTSFTGRWALPDFRSSGAMYFLIATLAGITFSLNASLIIQSQALELKARQRLDQLVSKQVGLSGNVQLIDEVIHIYEDAVLFDPGNVDAWIGLSAAICQLHYNDPAEFELTGARALAAAKRAFEMCPEYWLSSAQLGISHALSGNIDAAGDALLRAVKMAPTNSNAHYYYASFLTNIPDSRDEAISHVTLALEINPDNEAAQRLQRKLLIL